MAQTLSALPGKPRGFAASNSLAPKFYTSASHVEEEINRIFREGWIGVGRGDMVPSPGEYITLDLAGQNILLLRDRDNALKAYANTCRHRAARLLDGSGTCKGIRCPFHSWFYGLDGRLISAPGMDGAAGFDKANYGLIEYSAVERAGFVFLNLSETVSDIDAILGDFAATHAPWPLETLVTIRRRELTVACNWKLFLEVFNEYYHLPFVHPNSIDSIYSAPDPADLVDGDFATQFGRTQGTGGLLESDQDNALPNMPGLSGQALSGARYTWIFPNMTFAANRDALWCYEAYPLGPSECRVVQSACFHPDTVNLPGFDTQSAAYLDRLDAALAEDVPALENQQRGMSCPDAMSGRFHPDLEPNVARFAQWYEGRISNG